MWRHRALGVRAVAAPRGGFVREAAASPIGGDAARSFASQSQFQKVNAKNMQPRADRPRVPVVLPTAVALREMAGVKTPRVHEGETPEALAARLKRESNVAKAAAIEAARLARDRLETKAAVPEGASPLQQIQPPRPPPSSIPRKPLFSPFKGFNPFFDYTRALDEVTADAEEKAAKASEAFLNKKAAKAAKRAGGQSQTTSTRPAAPVPNPAAAVAKASVVGASSSSRVPYAPLAPRPLRASKVLAAREETLRASRDTLESMEQSAIQAAQAAMLGLDGAQPEQQAQSAQPAQPPPPPPTKPAKARGPPTPTASIKFNKHGVNTINLQQPQPAKSTKPGKKEKDPNSKRSAKAAARAAAVPGPDGKLPLQSATQYVQPKLVAWHPALYLKQFLLKIHPDLYHQEGREQQLVRVGNSVERQQLVASDQMVLTNQETVAKFNAIVDYYKLIKALPPGTQRIPSVPVLPPHPQTITFYCRVCDLPAEVPGAAPLTAEAKAALPTHIKLFEGEWALSAFDLSSLPRLLAQIEELFIRLALTTQIDLDPTVRRRWDVLVRQRRLEKELWAAGETVQAGQLGAYLTKDPTPDSYASSPGRYQAQYLSYYAQTPTSHAAISHGRGFNAQSLYNPLDPTAARLPPLLENMLRSGLLHFNPDLDMLQRLTALQTLIAVFTGYDTSHLYIHLWLGVRIRVNPRSYEYEDEDHNYRYSADEWELPWNFDREKLVDLIRQYLHSYHADNPNGFALLDSATKTN